MPLESASFINDLVSTNPAATDQVNQGYQQINLVKAVLKGQFPNWTSAALNATNGQLDLLAGMLSNNVWTIPASAAAHDGGHVILAGQGSDFGVLIANQFGDCGFWKLSTPTGGTSTHVATIDHLGNFLTGATTNSFVGEIRFWAGSPGSLPSGWQVCDGTGGKPNLPFMPGYSGLYFIIRVV